MARDALDRYGDPPIEDQPQVQRDEEWLWQASSSIRTYFFPQGYARLKAEKSLPSFPSDPRRNSLHCVGR